MIKAKENSRGSWEVEFIRNLFGVMLSFGRGGGGARLGSVSNLPTSLNTNITLLAVIFYDSSSPHNYINHPSQCSRNMPLSCS